MYFSGQSEMEELHRRKVGLKVGGSLQLIVVEMELGLNRNIELLKEEFNMPSDKEYALRVTHCRQDSKRNKMYVTEETFASDVLDGNELELVLSLNEIISKIFDTSSTNHLLDKFKSLFDLATDPAFIRKLVEKKLQLDVLNILKWKGLDEVGRSGCLLTMLQLLQGGHIKTVTSDILEEVVGVVRNKLPETQYALSIINRLSMELLLSFVLSKNSATELSLNVLILINAIIKTVKDEKKNSIINELNMPTSREVFFKLIDSQAVINNNLAAELFRIQTYLLSPYTQPLSRIVSWDSLDDSTPRNSRGMDDEFSVMDFDCETTSSQGDTFSVYKDNVSRYSLASISTYRSSCISEIPDANTFISQLTSNCLGFYRRTRFQNFCQSQSEENTYDPGICRSSERVVQIIAQALNVGSKPQKRGNRYVPLFFNPMTKHFFEEVYVRMMYVLSQNRRKMKARSAEDYEKLLAVLKKQVEMILERKPKTWLDVGLLMSEISYETVRKEWKKERQSEFMTMLRANPCIIELSKEFAASNEKLLRTQRISVLCNGGIFPRLPEKKNKNQHFMLKLSANERVLYMGECNSTCDDFKDVAEKKDFNVDQIRHLITGKACPHVKDNMVSESKANLAFSLLFPNDFVINCLAGDEKAASYWMDGFNMLLGVANHFKTCTIIVLLLKGNSTRSQYYWNEVDELSEMDTALHLIELQNVKIPTKPPPIPPLVATRPSPTIPPKKRNSRMSQSPIHMEDTVVT